MAATNKTLSVKGTQVTAIGLKASAGRYGGTYAHKDIAFEFGMWISAEFKIYLIKEFQRLKDEEAKVKNLDWNIQRIFPKINYRIHTDAIKDSPKASVYKSLMKRPFSKCGLYYPIPLLKNWIADSSYAAKSTIPLNPRSH